jgi:hypothetical protein
MKRWMRLVLGSAALPLFAACSGGDASGVSHEGVANVAEALSASGIPFPLPTLEAKDSAWDGSLVDLMVVDTWATCGFVDKRPEPINHKLVDPGDIYLDNLIGRAGQIMGSYVNTRPAGSPPLSPYALGQWLSYRNDAQWNRNRSTGQLMSAALKPRLLANYALILPDPNFADALPQANESVSLAAMNACIAQGVRSLSLGGDMLTLTEAEQIQALEVVRERSQIALLEYASIFNAIAAPAAAVPTTKVSKWQAVAAIQAWAAKVPTDADSVLKKKTSMAAWVNDFAAMVQLHLAATSDLADLFTRSAAAKSPRGGAAVNGPVEQWGAGSWRQRLLALLYGGDPLAAEADGSAPWANMVGNNAPGMLLDKTVRLADPWPTRAELPYFTVESKDPHVAQMFALARGYDALRVLVPSADGSVDIETSAEQMYRAVEARLRTEKCDTLTATNTCQVFTASDIPAWSPSAGATPIDTYTLFNSFGITKDHARVATRLLDEYTPMTGAAAIHFIGGTTTDSTKAWRIVPKDVDQVPRALAEIAPLFERYAPYRIPATVDPNVLRSHNEQATNLQWFRIGDDQGLAAGGNFAEAMRTFGAIPTISLTRDVLRRIPGSSAAPAELKTPLSAVSDGLIGTLDAAIGQYSTRMTPVETSTSYDWSNSNSQLQGLPVTTERLQKRDIVLSPFKLSASWSIDVDVSPDNTFFTADTGVTYDVIPIKNDPSAYALALSSLAKRLSDGKGIADLVADAVAQKTNASATFTAPVQGSSVPGVLHAELSLPVEKLTGAPPLTWTIIVRKSVKKADGTAGALIGYVPITGATPVYAWQFNSVAKRVGELAPVLAYQFAGGGSLGRLATQAWTVQRSNPSQPAYDGFGLPYTWVPAADATAFGSQPGDSVMTYFLRNARDAAAQATDAVRTAIESSARAQQATLDQQAAQARSKLVMQQETARLCGAAAGSRSCVPTVKRVNLSWAWTPLHGDVWQGVSDPGAYCDTAQGASDPSRVRQLDCFARALIRRTMTSVPVSGPVIPEMYSSRAPTFDQYAGGEIQTVLIDQWSAVRRLFDAAKQVEAVKKGAAAHAKAGEDTVGQLQALFDAAKTQLDAVPQEMKDAADKLQRTQRAMGLQCAAVLDYLGSLKHTRGMDVQVFGQNMTLDAKYSGWDVSKWDSSDADQMVSDVEALIQGSKAEGSSWSTLRGLESACIDARQQFENARAEADRAGVMKVVQGFQTDAAQKQLQAGKDNVLAEAMDGVTAVQREATNLDSAVGDMAKTIAQIARFKKEAELAIQRQKLEESITVQATQLSLGLNREYSHYDWWRARALLDGARRYAVAARRAIETNYVTELSTLTSPEAFVAAPSAWAEDVYRYDLSMPSAVGLSTGQAADGSQYPNQVLDYVGNLERFVQGFAVQRPMSAAVDDEIVTVPGPGASIVVSGNVVPDPARTAWSALCPAGTACTTASSPGWCSLASDIPVSQTCAIPPNAAGGATTYAAPTRIRATLFLDAWGQSVGRAPIQTFDARVNTRWSRLAVNLVGNGIRDCSTARNPNDCQANQYLHYDLRHEGPSLAIGATRQWRLLDVPLAQIESGKAATLGEFLDVEQNAWGKPFVESIARTEMVGRPMNGTYVIELEGDASVTFDRIEALQILYGSTYWVTQR